MINETLREIKASVNIADIIGPRLQGGLKRSGLNTLVGLCYFHDEKTPSFTVNEKKQIYKCFGCGAAGDVFDFLVGYGESLPEAVNIVKGITGGQIKPSTPSEFIAEDPNIKKWVQVKDIPATAPKPNFTHFKLGEPTDVFAYKNSDGAIMGYILRYLEAKQKTMRPYIYATDGKHFDWRFTGFQKPTPLYNLHHFKDKPNHAVLIVEGEKAANAGSYLMDGKKVVTTWQYGSQSTHHVDFSPLKDRDVYLWPDNDLSQKYGSNHPKKGEVKPWAEQPGNFAMLEIYEQIKGIAKSVKWIKNSPNFKDKWDIADHVSIWSEKEAQDYLRENTIPVPGSEKKENENKNTPPPANPKPPKPKKNDKFPFKVLGFEKQDSGPHKYYFYSYENNTVVALRPDQMKDVNLTTIANLDYWTKFYPGRKDGVDIKSVVNSLVSLAHQVGVVSFDDFRGRGAWIDRDRVVIHAGSHLIVDGKNVSFQEFDSYNIYEQSRILNIDLSKTLASEESKKFLDICKMLNWDRPQNARLLAGWMVVAPVCGVLNWRPHIWVTGPSGGGKSTIMQQIVKPMIKNVALTFQASTTEPGVRQRLKNDAVPVLFDEADVDGREDAQRIQAILGLMRASSSSDGGEIAKGTSGQVARTFTAKTCFAFSSIALQVSAQQDRSRVTILGLKENENKPEKFAELLRCIATVITEDYAKQLQARTIANLTTILHNTSIFAKAATIVLGRARSGDQLGALLAGAYSLESDDKISLDDALAIMTTEDYDWNDEIGLETTKDELLLLQHLMEQIVFLENADGIGKVERNIGELIKAALWHFVDDELSPIKAEDRLRRLGIKVDGNWVTISNTSIHIKKYLENTGWQKNYNKILLRLDGAIPEPSTFFTTEIRTRAVKVPVGHISTASPIDPPRPPEAAKMTNDPPPLKQYPIDPPTPLGDEDLPF